MRILLFVLALTIVLLVLLFGVSSKKGSIWKIIFTLLQIASLARNNSPGYR